METINTTPFTVREFLLPDRDGAETLLVVVKGTWRIRSDSTLQICEEQVPVHLAPVYHGEPGASTLLHDTDIVLKKPGTDCILLGRAWAPRGRVPFLDVLFAVGPQRKTIRVFGERMWMKWLWTLSMSKPVPFESMPLLWERSFGGVDARSPDPAAHEACLANPVGRGLLAHSSVQGIDGLLLPNLENPTCLITKPTCRPNPAGFAPIPPHWQPRSGYAGTFDEQWRKYVSPLPPEDQDLRFYATAAPGLTTAQCLKGSETVVVENASKTGRTMHFELPGVTPQASIRTRNAAEELGLVLDTVVVEPDEERLVLTWRATRTVHGSLHDLRQITVRLSE